LDTYSLMTAIWKIRSELFRALTPLLRARDKNVFGTDFEFWPNNGTCYQQSKKTCQYTGTSLHVPQNWWTLVPQTAEKGCHVFTQPLFFALGDTASLAACMLYNRQQVNFGMCYVVARAYSPEQQNAGRAHACELWWMKLSQKWAVMDGFVKIV